MSIRDTYISNQPRLNAFRAAVVTYFEGCAQQTHAIHSIKSRIKDPDHLLEKIARKQEAGKEINESNLWTAVTDLIGVRLLHLHQDQFEEIHRLIMNQIEMKEWRLLEAPKAFSWDPEISARYEALGIKTEIRETYYTSVHYVIAPDNNNPTPTCCEIQVRTLFEEAWGEIDHAINYPHPTTLLACREQLRVLSKLVSTGTRLADAIFRTYKDLNGGN